MQTILPLARQVKEISVMKAYNEFAEFTLACSNGVRVSTPSGFSSERKGFGPGTHLPLGSFTGMPLARLHVPHGGAAKMPTQFGEASHCLQRACPEADVRSATRRRPELFWRLWSTPNDDLRP